MDLSIKVREDNPNQPVYILGQLIHNNQVIDYLKNLGIETIDSIPENLGGICIIRTHGATPETIQALEQNGCKIIDATCPDVKRVQDKARQLAEENYKVIIIGKPDHPEVIAIKAHADLHAKENSLVVSSVKDAEGYVEEINKAEKIGVVVQTTQKPEKFREILDIIKLHAGDLKVYDTICPATSKRQQEAKTLAAEVDLMIVVGSKSSANTTHLAEIVKIYTDTIFIETHNDLENYKELIAQAETIGITAGASTPGFVIEEVINNIGEKTSDQNNQ